MMKDIEELYNQVVYNIKTIEKSITDLQEKKDAYEEIRYDLYKILQKCREVKEGKEK